MKLREILQEVEIKILSEKKAKDGNTMTVTVPFVQADEKNQNGRTYPLSLLKREVSRIQGAVSKGAFVGTGDHPAGGSANVATASHLLQKVWLDDKGKGWAKMKIIPTQRGNAIMTLINHDAELGVSSRGYGTTSPTGIVQNDYKLTGIDIVMSPSYKEGTFDKSDIYESVNFEEDNEDKMFGLTEKYVEAMIESVYGMQITEMSFDGSLEDFKKKKGNLIRAEILVAHNHFEDTESALRHLGADEEAKRISSPVQRRVTEGEIYLEAKLAGVSPRTYCDKINANLDRQKKMESESDFTAEEVASILEEGRKSGINITDPEERKRILNIAREQKQKPILTGEENFIKFATAKGLKAETAKLLWLQELKKKKRGDRIAFSVKEKTAAGFGSETRPEARKKSKKIIEEGA